MWFEVGPIHTVASAPEKAAFVPRMNFVGRKRGQAKCLKFRVIPLMQLGMISWQDSDVERFKEGNSFTL
jgi:hypothetical protein